MFKSATLFIASALLTSALVIVPAPASAEDCSRYAPCGGKGRPSCDAYNACNRRNRARANRPKCKNCGQSRTPPRARYNGRRGGGKTRSQ